VIPKPKQESGGVETALDRQEGIRMAALIEELLGTGATPHNGNSFQWVHRAH
jgi:hypothetical protein